MIKMNPHPHIIPILGELSNTHFVINLVSYIDNTAYVSYNNITIPVELHKYHCFRTVFPLSNKKEPIIIRVGNNNQVLLINATTTSPRKYKIVNCDCHFVPEVGIWDEMHLNGEMVFHLGDQLYLDLLFMKLAKKGNSVTNLEIRQAIYEEYCVAFQRKSRVLQSCFNVMLADDHEIADETLRTIYDKETTQRLIRIFGDIYYEIQGSLRLSDNKSITLDSTTFILSNNLRALPDESYAKFLYDLVYKEISNKKEPTYVCHGKMAKYEGTPLPNEEIIVLSPRVPMNNMLSCWVKLIYGKEENKNNYLPLYELLTNQGCKTSIICGDEHMVKKYIVTTRYGSCDVFFAGAINSPNDPYDSNDYVEGAHTEEIYIKRINGYMEGKEHVTKETGYCHCSYASYVCSFLCAKWC